MIKDVQYFKNEKLLKLFTSDRRVVSEQLSLIDDVFRKLYQYVIPQNESFL